MSEPLLTVLNKYFRRLHEVMSSDRHRLRSELSQVRNAARKTPDDARLTGRFSGWRTRFDKSRSLREWRKANLPAPTYPDLPVTDRRAEIREAIRKHPVVVISGETGSGKTTQIPKICLEAGRGIDGKIGCTQPRRIAAITVTERIAEEMGASVGDTLGYKIRFTDQTSERCFIKIMTDGILLAEAQGDRWLNEYDTLIIDEAHERSLNIDFILGILKTLIRKRRDLKLIITSATIDTEKFSRFFDDAPVIEVSGRRFPVEVRYQPTETGKDDADDTHVDMAVQAMEKLRQESPYGGDVLIFMPTEQDIRETCELLEGRNFTGVTVLPLFGRLSAGDQSRVFKPMRGRKIIVATNVAETSITIPGIRYVIDTGLARISQYLPRSRTTSLPVVPVSRSSADQRMGRCGRMAGGICIRLFSEEDYADRPRFTPPEILRSNLAEVILRMISLRLGDVRAFPFIDRPADKNIQDGIHLLEELGAIAKPTAKSASATEYRLTDRGRMMARLPIDPRLSRILIEADARGCLEEMTVIAAALSIPDPRERPAEKEALADRAHAAFKDPASDFITLLNVFRGYHEARTSLKTTRKMRAFCKENFLSFRRMREWRDVRYQITTILTENGIQITPSPVSDASSATPNDPFPPRYRDIHQAILSGFLSNIATHKAHNLYRAARDKEVMLFPGSGLFNNGGPWIMAAEMVETSRLFARTCARIDVGWIEPLAGDQCKKTYLEPHWEKKRGQVMAYEQVSLYGLIIEPRRPVGYGAIDPEEAHRIFIREALVPGDVQGKFRFIRHNLNLIREVQDVEDKIRRRDLLVTEEDLFAFYQDRLPETIRDIRSLRRLLRTRGGDQFLCMTPEDLYAYRPESKEIEQFPDRISLGDIDVPCDYVFDPGDERDGVTVRIPQASVGAVPSSELDWLVPGLLAEKIGLLLKGLPKSYRRRLVPLTDTIEIIAREMPREDGPLATMLSRFIHDRFGVDIPASEWPMDALPEHLKMRISIQGPRGEELRAGRDPMILKQAVKPASDARRFEALRRQWERGPLTDWDFDDLPDAVTLENEAGEKWVGYPGLRATEAGVFLHLFPQRKDMLAEHPKGMAALAVLGLGREVRQLKAHLKIPESLSAEVRYFGTAAQMEKAIAESVLAAMLEKNIRTAAEFNRLLEDAAPRLLEYGRERLETVRRIVEAYHECRSTLYNLENTSRNNAAIIRFLSERRDDLAALVPPGFVGLYDNERLGHLPRYIRAITLRAERGVVQPDKDQIKANELANHTEQLQSVLQQLSPATSDEKRAAAEAFFWLIEEYKVSLFAQELKTPVRVSAKRLGNAFADLQRMA